MPYQSRARRVGVLVAFFTIPPMGLQGAALAATAQSAVCATGMVIATWNTPSIMQCWGGWSWEAFTGWGAYLKVALPGALMVVVEWCSWEISTFLCGYISVSALGAQTTLTNIMMLIMPVFYAWGRGASAIIGIAFGEAKHDTMKQVVKAGNGVAVTAAVLVCLTIFFLFDNIVWIFTSSTGICLYADLALTILHVQHRHLPLCDMVLTMSPTLGIKDAANQVKLLFVVVQLMQFIQIFPARTIETCGKQALGAGVLIASMWLVALPSGSVLAFAVELHLVGMWWGLFAGSLVHVVAYIVIVHSAIWLEDLKAPRIVSEEESGPVYGALDDDIVHVPPAAFNHGSAIDTVCGLKVEGDVHSVLTEMGDEKGA